MRFLDRIMAAAGFEKRSATPPLRGDTVASVAGVFYPVGPVAAENVASVTACCNVIASAIASLPPILYRLRAGNKVEVEDHPLLSLVRQGPNEQSTWFDMIEAWVASMLLFGNGLLAIDRDDTGGLIGLRFIPWSWVTVSRAASGRLLYDVNELGTLGAAGRSYRLLETEVLHLKDRSDDGLIGRPRLGRAGDAIAAAIVAQATARSFLNNAMMPSIALEVPGTLSPEQAQRLREQLNTRYTGAENAGRALVLDGNIKASVLQVTPEDAELLESRRFSVEEVCRVFQVPPPLVQDYSRNTFTNAATAGLWFGQFTLGPIVRKIEAEFSRSLLPSGYALELDMSAFLRGDPATRWQAHKIALETGALTVNEVREIEGFDPLAAEGPLP